jgi:hypothetical protein
MRVVVVIASSTRGFAVPEADTPPVISPYARSVQDQDEKGSVTGDEISGDAYRMEPLELLGGWDLNFDANGR